VSLFRNQEGTNGGRVGWRIPRDPHARIRICPIALAHARVIREPRFRHGAFNPEALLIRSGWCTCTFHLFLIALWPLRRTCRMSRTLFFGHPSSEASSSLALKMTTFLGREFLFWEMLFRFSFFLSSLSKLARGGILCDIGPRAHLPSTRPAGSLSIPPGVALRGAAYSSDFVFFVLRLEGRRCRLVVRAKPVCSSWAIFPHFSTFSRLGKIAMPGRWSFSLYHRFVSVCRDPRRITYSVDVLLSPGSSWQLLSAFCFE
jgi:hypothetical protein